MSAAVVLAFAAGSAAVLAAWELLGALHAAEADGARGAGRLLAPLRLAGLAGREPTAAERRRLAAVAALSAVGAGWLLAGPGLALVLGGAGPLLVRAAVARRRRRWREDLAEGAAPAARALADALAGGHALRGAVAQAAAGGAVPGAAGRELAALATALALGEPTDAALEHVRRRAASPPWDALVAAMLLTREAGGDLAGVLRSLAAAQEEARRVEADARTATAQARFTAQLVAGLPLGAVALAELASPGYLLDLAGSPLTLALLLAAAALQATALAAVRRLARPA